MTEALIPAVSIEAIVGKRDEIARLVREANAAMCRAHEIARDIESQGGAHVSFALSLEYRHATHRYWGEKPEHAMAMTQEVDRRIWDFVVVGAGIWTLMDTQAREEWRKQMESGAFPAVSVDSIHATLASLADQRAEIFERSVVNLFRGLSWDYKSNRAVKLGKRIVLTSATEWWRGGRGKNSGSPGHHGVSRMDDLLRVLAVLEGHPEPSHAVGVERQLRAQEWPNQPDAIVGILGLAKPLPLFEVRGFKNGNAHVRIVDEKHVDELNRIIARRCPDALPPADL